MKRLGKLSILAALMLATMASIPALAHGGHYRSRVSVGFVFGGPWYYPYYPAYAYYPPAYAYYPPVVSYPPQVYVERSDAPAAAPAPQQQQAQGYWYYCADSRSYYPYVRQCAVEWQRVPPQPQPQQ